METTILGLGFRVYIYIRIMENKVGTTIQGLGFRDITPNNGESNAKERGT